MKRALVIALCLGCGSGSEGGETVAPCGSSIPLAEANPPAATSGCWKLTPAEDGAMVIIPNAAIGPGGSNTASWVQASSASGEKGYSLARYVYFDTPGTYTFEFWAKNNGGAGATYSVWGERDFSILGHPVASVGEYKVPQTSYLARLATGEWAHIAQEVTVTTVPTTFAFMPLDDYTSSNLFIADVRVVASSSP